MKKKKRNVDVYVNGKVKVQVPLIIQVDNAGDEWLTLEQVDFLEFAHMCARYEANNQLKLSRALVKHAETHLPSTSAMKSSDLDSSLFRSTPAFSGVY